MMNSELKNIFDKSRQELLDMGLRGNTLLSLGKGQKVLDIVDEKSSQVFDILVGKAKTMEFLAAPGELDSGDESLSLRDLKEHLESSIGDQRYDDNKLQTQLFRKGLDNRLLKIHADSLTYKQEQGVDLLYIATGFLKWYESPSSDKERYAPLVLIPVELVRGEAGEAFKLHYTGAELGTNLTLASKLKMEFAMELPSLSEDEESISIDDYLSQVEKAIASEERWEVVHDKIALSFFSFGKFQMYQDLAEDSWPDGKKPSENEIIKKLFGGGFESDANHLAETTIDVNKTEEVQLVLDSDSSQTEAVLAAKSGANLVIQGPPGTGKSQTITNIISQALSDNKKVLFVAEKMAALEVVKRRLDNCHLGDAVLELHSHKANKKAVLSSLEETLLQDMPVTPERHEEVAELVSLRKELDEHSEVVNKQIGDTGYSYQKALGEFLKAESALKAHGVDLDSLPELDISLNTWSNSQYRQCLGKLEETIDYLTKNSALSENIYVTTQLKEFSPSTDKQVRSLVGDLKEAQHSIVCAVKEYAFNASITHNSESYYDVTELLEALTVIQDIPDLLGLNADEKEWGIYGDDVISTVQSGIALQQERQSLEQEFLVSAFTTDWSEVREILSTTGKKWWKGMSGKFRNAQAEFGTVCKSGIQGNVTDWIAKIDQLSGFIAKEQQFFAESQYISTILGDNYQGLMTDWEEVLKPLLWIKEKREEIQVSEFSELLHNSIAKAEGKISSQDIEAIKEEIDNRTVLLKKLVDTLLLDEKEFSVLLAMFDESDLQRLELDADKLYELSRFVRFKAELKNDGLTAWQDILVDWQHDLDLVAVSFKYQFFKVLVDQYYDQEESIYLFDRIDHENTVNKFRKIDGELFSYAQEKLVAQLYSSLPNPRAKGEIEVLRREFNKKRRQLPIRRLLNVAGRAVQQIKPVFMMSPMSISTYLEPGSIEFDLVIFDEASQVKVADALGAILRGKQVVVVGDTKQMPPTSFFGKQFVLDDEEAEESLTADIESILGMFLSSGAPEKMLRWHYRSRHESLINVSNQEFYDNKLMVFPSSGINPYAKGLSLNYLENTTYDRGGARVSKGEATAVAEAVMLHAMQMPNQTLGVVAFSVAQRDAIMLEVERLRKANPDLEGFFAEHPQGEDFFVKNLENVQGDERDTIFISIGYGKTPEGRFPMSFGPLGSEGGERRLNVLITRSRMSMEVFCNFKAEEMATTADTPFGVRALKNFLQYADTKELVRREETGKEPDSPFEEEVISAIRSLGYEVQPQVGSAGFYIDIAVRDPSKPGRYMLAVECDGATYHSSKSARDRDRIRQSVLEGIGWRFHRIWSTDWFRNMHIEVERLKQALEEAVACYQNFDEKILEQEQSQAKVKADIQRVESDDKEMGQNYRVANVEDLQLKNGQAIPDVSPEMLAEDIHKIVNTESPIHIKKLGIRLLSAVGAARSGAKINSAILNGVRAAEAKGYVQIDGEFILHTDKEITVRSRKELPSNERKFDFVYDGEIANAALDTIQATYSIAKDDLTRAVSDMLGFSSTSKAMKLRIESVLSSLIEGNKANLSGVVYTPIQ